MTVFFSTNLPYDPASHPRPLTLLLEAKLQITEEALRTEPACASSCRLSHPSASIHIDYLLFPKIALHTSASLISSIAYLRLTHTLVVIWRDKELGQRFLLHATHSFIIPCIYYAARTSRPQLTPLLSRSKENNTQTSDSWKFISTFVFLTHSKFVLRTDVTVKHKNSCFDLTCSSRASDDCRILDSSTQN